MDDGIELNFAAPSSAGVARQLAPKKGGRWTDRVKAKQAVRRVVKQYETAPAPKPKSQPAKESIPVHVAKPPPRTAPSPVARPKAPAPRQAPAVARPQSQPQAQSRAKPAPAPRPDSDSDDEPQAGPSRLPMPAKPAQPAGPQIISSLFTANPSLPAIRKPLISLPVGAPSNAPIDTSTFEGLGLDPLLVHHLKTKMGIAAPTAIQKSALPYLLSSPLDINARREEDEDGNLLPVVDESLRDVFIQSQTGSGKTFSFLLPIIQALLPLSKLSYIDRSIGTLAIILAPTRELAQQISKVLESLLAMALSLPDDEEDRGFTRWLVGGLLVGGSTRTHDKARLRKGVPILVATPGRLLDHLQNTQSFKCAKCLYFVMDEADRLMDLGFEETITGIIKALDGRRRNEINAEREQDEEGGGLMRWPYWNRGRQTVLCSATINSTVERLAGVALRDPVVFRSTDDDKVSKTKGAVDAAVADALQAASAVAIPEAGEKFTPPSQLSQKYVVTPTKLRLVTLVALLRSLVGSAAKVAVDSDAKDGTKVIVFLSSTDAVDYHFRLLGGMSMGAPQPEEEEEEEEDGKESADEGGDDEESPKEAKSKKPKNKAKTKAADEITLRSLLFPNTTIQRLHGSLPLRTRLASLKAFSTASAHASILLATSVASRGLDLPLVRAVVQYDLPTEGGAAEYVHRVGRTARAGQGGEAWAFVAPAEAEWIPWVEGKMGAASESTPGEGSVRLQQVDVNEVLKRGFGGRGHEYEARATETQLAFERWVLADDANATLARKAFSSFVRAYSTHPLEERRFFAVKALHLGHLAKAFALREAPGAITAAPKKSKSKKERPGHKRKRGGDSDSDDDRPQGKEATARNETERRMYEAVRKQGRMVKSGGALGIRGGDDFQVMGAGELEKMVAKRRWALRLHRASTTPPPDLQTP